MNTGKTGLPEGAKADGCEAAERLVTVEDVGAVAALFACGEVLCSRGALRRLCPSGQPQWTRAPSSTVAIPAHVMAGKLSTITPTFPHSGHGVVLSPSRKTPIPPICAALGRLLIQTAPVVVRSPCRPCPTPSTFPRCMIQPSIDRRKASSVTGDTSSVQIRRAACSIVLSFSCAQTGSNTVGVDS